MGEKCGLISSARQSRSPGGRLWYRAARSRVVEWLMGDESRKVAFIGLGVMGFPMAGHLASAGHTVTVFNRTRARAEDWLAKHPGRVEDTPAAAARGAGIVFACVGNDDDLRSVVLGPDGAFAGMASGGGLRGSHYRFGPGGARAVRGGPGTGCGISGCARLGRSGRGRERRARGHGRRRRRDVRAGAARHRLLRARVFAHWSVRGRPAHQDGQTRSASRGSSRGSPRRPISRSGPDSTPARCSR